MAIQAGPDAPGLDAALINRLTARVVASGGSITTTAPFTGLPLAVLPVSTAQDVDTAFARARAAQLEWSRLSPAERVQPFLRLHDAILDRAPQILDILQWETGKARRHAMEEVLDVAGCGLYYVRHAPGLLKPRRRAGVAPVLTRTHELRQPKGVVGLISPWNYPLALGVTDAVPALLAGNAIVHKPDTQTALTTLWAIDLLIELGMPADIWQVVLGAPDSVGDALIGGADYVAFTGSTRAGRAIAQKAATRLVGCSLELGGKNPMLVLADADLDQAAQGACRACFTNAGQLCISMERLYVDESVYEPFLDRFSARAGAMTLSSALDWSADMGSLTYPRQLEVVTSHVRDAVAKGAVVRAGGNARPDIGPLFFEPTILTGVTSDMLACAGETFGPVVSVYPVASEHEAIERANDTSYGLNASVWTKDIGRGRRVAAQIKAGSVNINEGYGTTYASYDAPMGGMKQSGLGRRHGADGLLRFTEAQTIASQRGLSFEPMFGMSHERHAALLGGMLKIMKRLHMK